MDNSNRLEYNWIPYEVGEDVEHTNLLFNQWIDENPDQYTVQVSYPRSGRHWLRALIDDCVSDKLVQLRWIDDEDKDAKYLFAHPMAWPEFDERLKYVYVMRDPRDAILSAIKFRDEYWIKEFWKKQCDWYRYSVNMFLNMNSIVVQYEKLCLYPVEELVRIFQFSGLKFDGNTIGDSYRIWGVVTRHDGFNYNSGQFNPKPTPITSSERYTNQCLKWQRDERFLEEEYHIMIWAKLKDIMLPFGYTFDGHSTNLLTR